jgi:hypothetical protein
MKHINKFNEESNYEREVVFTSKRNEDLGDQSIDDFIPNFDQ